MRPLVHRGSSANIDYYGEPGPERPGRIWCEVLCSSITFARGDEMPRRKAIPDYHVTIYQTKAGEIGKFTYTPEAKPRSLVLSARKVTELVQAELGVTA